jgi:antitoxin HicB
MTDPTSDPGAYRCKVAPIPPEDGGVARFPNIPGYLGVGDAPEEAVEDARKVLFACLDALKAVDRATPAPSAPTSRRCKGVMERCRPVGR